MMSLHLGGRGAATLTRGGGHQGRVDGDEVTLWPQLIQGHLLHPPAGRHLPRSDGVVADGLGVGKVWSGVPSRAYCVMAEH